MSYHKNKIGGLHKPPLRIRQPEIHAWRVKLVEACLGLAALILVARLVQIQIVEHKHYEWIAKNQHTGDYLQKAKRGSILDRNGKPLALNQPCYEIAVHKRLVEDLVKTGERLAKVLYRDKSEILHVLDKPSPFVVVGRRVPAEQAHTIQMMRLPGITITEMSERIYPLNEKLAQVLGFVGTEGKGLSGVEYAFDRYLRGHDGLRVVQRDAMGKKVMPVYASTEEEKDGDTLVLTIDRVVQIIAEEELDAAIAKYHARGGSVVILNPRSGEILAMASRPGFDANQATKRAPNAWRIRPITDIFEPGSTFKIVTMMAALADSIKKPNDIVFCENGQYKLFGQTINDPEKHGWLSVRDVLKYSSNIGIAKIAQEVGKRRLFQAARSLGFGNKTGIDLPGEVSGILKNPTEWSRFSLAAIAYGHEVAVTPLQVAMAYAAVANGGKLMKPGIVKEIRTPKGERVYRFRPQKIRTVMNEKTAAIFRDILRQVVESGTAQMAQVEGLDIAGKTGTAQKPLPDSPGYSDNKFVASFVGFFPADQPRLLVFVDLDEPFPVHSGGHVAAPTFRRIVTKLMKVWSPPPIETVPSLTQIPESTEQNLWPEVEGRDVETAERILKEQHLPYRVVGQGRVVQEQHLEKDDHNKVTLVLTLGNPDPTAEYQKMPDLTGLSVRQAVAEASRRGLKVKLFGRGRVYRQKPEAGSKVRAGAQCMLECRPPVRLSLLESGSKRKDR